MFHGKTVGVLQKEKRTRMTFCTLSGNKHNKLLKWVRIIQVVILGLDNNSNVVHGLAK